MANSADIIGFIDEVAFESSLKGQAYEKLKKYIVTGGRQVIMAGLLL